MADGGDTGQRGLAAGGSRVGRGDQGVSGQLSLIEKFSEGLTMDLLKG